MAPLHTLARTTYPNYPERAPVSDDQVPWSVSWPAYKPVMFTAPHVFENDRLVKQGGWADPPDPATISSDEWSTRGSYEGPIVFEDNIPVNPRGRTGMVGRGFLGKWGPNHAADPIVTRFHPTTGKPQVVLIVRRDTGKWALPGGMVDAGEVASLTVKREFTEEAVNIEDPAERERVTQVLDRLFAGAEGKVVYRGYVDDPRNTDNSWMETTAYHFHCEGPAARIELHHGDDAAHASWVDLIEQHDYFSPDHKRWVDLVAENNLSGLKAI